MEYSNNIRILWVKDDYQYIEPIVEAIGVQINQYIEEFKTGSGNNKARMTGKAVGAITFEVLVLKGAGVVAKMINISKKTRIGTATASEVKYLLIKKGKFDEIIAIPKGNRPDPSTYLSQQHINAHLAKFDGGVTKIAAIAPTGAYGPPGGTFVIPKSVADNVIAQANGNVATMEQLLGFPTGSLGNSPVRVNIPSPSGLRMPSGNEVGANAQWIPGGFTSPGGMLEAIIDQVPSGSYIVSSIN